ncbi:MAG: urease accessory protein UreF [Microcoleus sp.]
MIEEVNSQQSTVNSQLLCLLQLAFAPVGAYSYSEGIESLVETGAIANEVTLRNWLQDSLQFGAIRVEAAVAVRALRAAKIGDLTALSYWNGWATAAKETEELRSQSWQMGRTLLRLLLDLRSSSRASLTPAPTPLITIVQEFVESGGNPCNFAIGFGIAAACWQIEEEAAVLGYLYSWATNLASAGVKLIPLGQTAGQQLLLDLRSQISCTAQEVLKLEDDDLASCSWGLALASMAHETQYTRLFRS